MSDTLWKILAWLLWIDITVRVVVAAAWWLFELPYVRFSVISFTVQS